MPSLVTKSDIEKVLKQYETNEIYKNVIDTMKNYIEENIDKTPEKIIKHLEDEFFME